MLKIVYFNTFFGHLSLALTGLGKQDNIYISFYQRTSDSPVEFRLHNLLQDGLFKHNALDPSHDAGVYKIIWIPTEEYCGYGLSEAAMFDWWKTAKRKNMFYALFTYNCSSMVYDLLRVGQEHSVTLNRQALPFSCFITRPSVVSAYAENLRENIVSKLKEDQVAFTRLLALHIESQLPNASPYSTLYAWAVRLRQFNATNSFSEMVNRPFCNYVKKTLRHFRKEMLLRELDQRDVTLLNLTMQHDLPPVDLELHLRKILQLADYVSQGYHQGKFRALDHLFQYCLRTILFTRWRVFMNYLAQPSLMNKQDISDELSVLRKKIIDENNPHADLYFASPPHKLFPRLS